MFSNDGLHPTFTAVYEENNLFHMPNLSIAGNPDAPYVAHAPVSENILWTPRCLGRRDPATLVLDTNFATPADTVRDTKPLTGSSAIGAAVGLTAYDSLGNGGVSRGASKDVGAWQVS